MSIGLGDVTVRANDLIAAGEYAAAQDLLAAALADADPSPARATPESAQAAALLAKIHVTLGDAHAARGWSSYAYAATTALYGPRDAHTTDAAITLAAVLHRVGSQDKAARLYSDAILELSALEGPESPRVLAAHADLATVEYARGDCGAARTRLEDAWELQREVYGEGQPAGIRMLAKLAAMERDCGRYDASHEHFALAQELCRTHLPAEHPLVNQVAALARAAPDPDHTCAVEDSEGIGADAGAPPPRTPYANGGATGSVPQPREPDPLDAYAADRYLGPAAPPDPDPPATGPAGPPPHDDPAWADADADAAAYGARTDTDADADAEARAWADADAQADAEERRAAGEPYAWETGPRIFDPSGSAPPGTAAPPPPVPDNLPAPYLPPPRPRRLLPVVLAGLLVVLLGAVAVIAGFGLLGDEPVATPPPSAAPTTSPPAPPPTSAPAPPPTSAPAPPPPAAAGTPPGRVTLADGGDSVTLNWTYPRGAPGPVVVSAGPPGQTPQAIIELPAGTTNYVAYGLPSGSDFCFVVSVVYSPRSTGRAAPVCTAR